MNWKLIFALSLFGLAMALLTIAWIPTSAEPFFWIAIFVLCGYHLAKRAPGKLFLHGFLTSMINSVWITGAHVAAFATYMTHHPEMAVMNAGPLAHHPRVLMLFVGPCIGAASGLVLGLITWILGRILRSGQQ